MNKIELIEFYKDKVPSIKIPTSKILRYEKIKEELNTHIEYHIRTYGKDVPMVFIFTPPSILHSITSDEIDAFKDETEWVIVTEKLNNYQIICKIS